MTCALCNVKENLDYYSRARSIFGYSLTTFLEPIVLSNAAPSHDECALIEDSISSLSAKSVHLGNIIARQDKGIANLSLILDKYQSSRREMLAEQARVNDLLNRHRCALTSPIRKLPVDIMREIFVLASSNAADITDIAWTATHTCTKWRDIAMETPILWSNIHVTTDERSWMNPRQVTVMPELEWLHVTSPRPSNENCVRRAIELSQDVPLVISFIHTTNRTEFSHENAEMLRMLLEQAPRWRKAHLATHSDNQPYCSMLERFIGRVPMLEYVFIDARLNDSPPKFFQRAPRLRTVVIATFHIRLEFPWQQIRKLDLNGCHELPYFLHALHSAKNVEHLTISPLVHPRQCYGDGTDVSSSISLPAVRALDVFANFDSLFLPSQMVLPALEVLRVVERESYPEDHRVSRIFLNTVRMMLRSSGCVLTHATFLPIVEFGPAFRDVISECHTLVYLDVGFTPPRQNIEDVFTFINQKNVLPTLWTLKIGFGDCTISEDAPYIAQKFVETALSRKHTLKVFDGSVDLRANKNLPYTTILSATNRESLQRVKSRGISITVRLTAKKTTREESLEFA